MRLALALALAVALVVPAGGAAQEPTPMYAPDDLEFTIPSRIGQLDLGIRSVDVVAMLAEADDDVRDQWRDLLLPLGKGPSDVSVAVGSSWMADLRDETELLSAEELTALSAEFTFTDDLAGEETVDPVASNESNRIEERTPAPPEEPDALEPDGTSEQWLEIYALRIEGVAAEEVHASFTELAAGFALSKVPEGTQQAWQEVDGRRVMIITEDGVEGGVAMYPIGEVLYVIRAAGVPYDTVLAELP